MIADAGTPIVDDAAAARSCFEIGRTIVQKIIDDTADRDPQDALRLAWNAVLGRHEWLFRGRALFDNRFNVGWKNIVFLDLLAAVRRRREDFRPIVRLSDMRMADRIASPPEPLVCATIHSGLSLTVNRLFEQLGLSSALIVARAIPDNVMKDLGFDQAPDVLPRGPNCLIMARQKLREGKAVCCNVDFTIKETPNAARINYIGKTLFEFCRKVGARLIYAYPTVSDSGEIVILAAEPEVMVNTSDPTMIAEDFRRFLVKTVRGDTAWSIGSWHAETEGRADAVRGAEPDL